MISNYIACLSVKDESHFESLINRLDIKKIKYTIFREPDVCDQITAIAIEPCDDARRVCSSFPLALKKIGCGINKNQLTMST